MALEDTTNMKNKRKQLSSFVRGQIVGMHMLNGAVTQISDILNIPISTVRDVIHLYTEKGVEAIPKRSGRPKVFSDRAKSTMTRAFRAAPFMPIATQHRLFIAGGVELSYSTFRRRMLDLGFASYSPAKKPALSDRHKLNRLQWCQEKVDWTVDQWKSVVWSDESRYTIVGNDGGFRVVRKEGERYLEQHILETHKFGKGSIMLWGCFWYGGLGPLVALTGKIDQDAYVNCLAQNFPKKLGKSFCSKKMVLPVILGHMRLGTRRTGVKWIASISGRHRAQILIPLSIYGRTLPTSFVVNGLRSVMSPNLKLQSERSGIAYPK
jgi:transposase